MTNDTPNPPSFREALAFWFRLGFISFGGPAGQIAILHDYLVEKKRWIHPSKFFHALNYCMLLPGPEAQQLATYTGWMLHGWRGGLAAGVLFVLPSALLLWGLSVLYVSFGQMPAIQSALALLKPTVLAIVVLSIIKIGQKSLSGPMQYAVAALAFVAIFFFKAPFPLIVIGASVMGWLIHVFGGKKQDRSGGASPLQADREGAYFIDNNTVVAGSGYDTRRLIRQVLATLVLWGAPLAALYFFAPPFDFWKNLSLFFSKAALVTFGGAYAVLPYVAQVSVEKYGWLSQMEMLDGLALGESTPGPLIIVLAYVGFMAGYHTFGGSVPAGSLALGLTVFYTFLPSFFFVLAGAPLIEKTREQPAVKSVLQYATAAVAGVMLSLCLYLGQAVLMPEGVWSWLPLVWMIVSFAALHYFRINMLTWIVASILSGWLVSAIT
ncbi:MAG: chromate efflux transporter [Saprospiraceae bacterium]|nr:chromate efflux transporter [Saprospiraceae bacterium]